MNIKGIQKKREKENGVQSIKFNNMNPLSEIELVTYEFFFNYWNGRRGRELLMTSLVKLALRSFFTDSKSLLAFMHCFYVSKDFFYSS